MPDVTMELDTRQASAFVRAVWADQLPFATAKAINDSAKGGQEVQRAHQRTIFKVRRPQFVDRAVKISQFAKKNTPEARMRVEPPGGQKRADILAKFETEDTKSPFRGRSIAVPSAAVPRTGAGVIRKGWRPSELFAQGQRYGDRAMLGDKDTILVWGGWGKGTIFRFRGRGKKAGSMEVLYQLVRSVPIEPELHFQDNIRRHVLDNWDANFNRAFMAAMQTAR